MQIASFLFLCFLLIVFVISLVVPRKFRWIWLLGVSYLFCITFDYKAAIVLLAITLIAYIFGRLIGNYENRTTKKIFLVIGLLLVLSVLFVFKYLNFSISIVHGIFSILRIPISIHGFDLFIALGISFYSLQVISYLIDIFNGILLAEKNPGKFALYVAFFPKLISGPIERGGDLLPQIFEPKQFEFQRFVDGLVRIGWGFFKKLVIADRFAVIVDTVFQSPDHFASPMTFLAVLAFSFQIYIDFSAYCDIAIGSAKILGIDLVENFNLPYFAKSVTEFWRRWHISFSSWLRDYIFTPLNFATRQKRSKIFQYLNILIVFLVSGIWHGANFTFIIWGLLHGFYQILEAMAKNMTASLKNRTNIVRNSFLHQFLQTALTFSLVTFAWIFFRADHLSTAFQIIKNLFTLKDITAPANWNLAQLGLEATNLWILLFSLIIFLIIEILQLKHDLLLEIKSFRLPLRWVIYYSLIFGIILFGYFGIYKPESFIYALF